MQFVQALILGIVEGFTEFLPISSTAHLVLAAKIVSVPQTDYWKFFEVFIQAGAILAVVSVYFKKLNRALLSKVIISFIPTALIGFLLYKLIKLYLIGNLAIIASAFIAVAFVFLFLEYLVSSKKLKLDRSILSLSFTEAIIIGVAQATAIIPGVSRAGAVLLACMFLRVKRAEAALYSFLLAVPTIFAAAALDVLKTNKTVLLNNMTLSITGFISAWVTAYFVVSWFVSYLQNNTLRKFAYYRIIVGALIFITLFLPTR